MALLRLVQNSYDGFNKDDSTVGVFIDMEKTFDSVWRKGLLHKLYNMGVKGRMCDWLYSFYIRENPVDMCGVQQREISKQKLDCLKVQCCHQCYSYCLLLTFTKTYG